AALTWCGKVGLIYFGNASLGALRDTVFIGGLQATQHGAVAVCPSIGRRQDGCNRVLARWVELALEVVQRRTLAKFLAQLSLPFHIRHLGFGAELTGGVDSQIFYRGNFKAVLIATVSDIEVGEAAITASIPGDAIARACFSKRRGAVTRGGSGRGGVDDVGVGSNLRGIAADIIVSAHKSRGTSSSDKCNACCGRGSPSRRVACLRHKTPQVRRASGPV